MIAKLIVWAPNRSQAIEKMLKVLANLSCVGVRTNQLFLQSCLKSSDFQNPAYTTSFIGKNLKMLLRNPYRADADALYQYYGAAAWMHHRALQQTSRSAFRNVSVGFRNQRFDPINRPAGIVVNVSEGVTKDDAHQQASLIIADSVGNNPRQLDLWLSTIPQPAQPTNKKSSAANAVTAKYNAISAEIRAGSWKSQSPQRFHLEDVIPLQSTADYRSDIVTASIAGKKATAIFSTSSQPTDPSLGTVIFAHIPALGTWAEYRIFSTLTYAESLRETSASAADGAGGVIKAPLPCKVLKILKQSGDEVQKGEILMVIESMKMEVSITAPVGGLFGTASKGGDAVEEGSVLCEVDIGAGTKSD